MEMLRNPQPRKLLHRGKGRRAGRRRQKKKNRASVTKRFAFGPISFPNNGSASQFQATPIPIGSKPGDNYWPSWEKVERRDALLRVLSAPLLHRFPRSATCVLLSLSLPLGETHAQAAVRAKNGPGERIEVRALRFSVAAEAWQMADSEWHALRSTWSRRDELLLVLDAAQLRPTLRKS
jgi:hypothetical protein